MGLLHFDEFIIKLRNWRMERIPEIELPSCIHCKQTMYWNRDKQDWACKPCDDYNFWMQAAEDFDDDCNDFQDNSWRF